MLVIKYTKIGRAKFISHLDFLRHFSRTLRRASVVLEMSKGYVPHELMYFAPPSTTGLTSYAEYCCIATSEKVDGFLEKFNVSAIEGVTALWVREIDKNPNLASKAVYAEYELPYEIELSNKIKSAFDGDKFEITFDKKGEMTTKDVRALMHSYQIGNDKIKVVLAVGENTLRIDRFLNAIGFASLVGVEKTKLFAFDVDGKSL
ncbi:MAG: TIGR03936 family radical SAM-associated protein, partial [Clostridia bacterium]